MELDWESDINVPIELSTAELIRLFHKCQADPLRGSSCVKAHGGSLAVRGDFCSQPNGSAQISICFIYSC